MQQATTQTEDVGMPQNPFINLSRTPIAIALPPPQPGQMIDQFTWVAFMLNGEWAAEHDARGADSFYALEGKPILALDLLPVPVECARHAEQSVEDCPMCIEQWRRSRLSLHRVLVPAGARAVFFRRRLMPVGPLPEGISLILNWTIIGYEFESSGASITDLRGNQLIAPKQGHYLCIDDSGRVLVTNDLAAID